MFSLSTTPLITFPVVDFVGDNKSQTPGVIALEGLRYNLASDKQKTREISKEMLYM
jgi:hypothetical protein